MIFARTNTGSVQDIMQAPISVESSWQPLPAIQAGVDAYLSLRWVAQGFHCTTSSASLQVRCLYF